MMTQRLVKIAKQLSKNVHFDLPKMCILDVSVTRVKCRSSCTECIITFKASSDEPHKMQWTSSL